LSSSDARQAPLGPAVALALVLLLAPALVGPLWWLIAPWFPDKAAFALIELLGILLPTVLLALGSPRSVALRWRSSPVAACGWAACGAAGLAGVLSYVQALWEHFTGFGPPPGLEAVLHIGSLSDAMWLVAGAVLLPAIAEESAFRGLIQARLERFGPLLAVAITSGLFAVFHHDAYGIPTYLAMGAYLGWLAWRFGSIWPAAAAHGANNALALLQANGLPEEWWLEHVAVVLPVALALALSGLWRLTRIPVG